MSSGSTNARQNRQIALVAVLTLVVACSPGMRTRVVPRTDVAFDTTLRFTGVLVSGDQRNALVGTWTYRIAIDAICDRRDDGSCEVPDRVRATTMTGELQITDSLFERFPATGLKRSELPAFAALTAREISCADPDLRLVDADRSAPEGLRLQFMPHARDCGVEATLKGNGDSLSGNWVEIGFSGPRSRGRISLVRRPSTREESSDRISVGGRPLPNRCVQE